MASRQDKHIDTVAQEGNIWLLCHCVCLDGKPYIAFLCYCVNVFVLTRSHILPSCATVSMCLSWWEAISYLLVLLCQCVCLDEKPYLTFLCYSVNVFVLTRSHILPSCATVPMCLSWREAISYLLVLLCQCVCLDEKPYLTFLCYCVNVFFLTRSHILPSLHKKVRYGFSSRQTHWHSSTRR
jgi:hypothetical protein